MRSLQEHDYESLNLDLIDAEDELIIVLDDEFAELMSLEESSDRPDPIEADRSSSRTIAPREEPRPPRRMIERRRLLMIVTPVLMILASLILTAGWPGNRALPPHLDASTAKTSPAEELEVNHELTASREASPPAPTVTPAGFIETPEHPPVPDPDSQLPPADSAAVVHVEIIERDVQAEISHADYGSDCLSANCHATINDHDSVHTETSGVLCGDCHASVGSGGAHEFQFTPTLAQRCLDCHDRELVDRDTGKTIANIASQIHSSTYRHGPVQIGECHACHSFHSGNHARLLRESYSSDFYQRFSDSTYILCFRCHDRDLVMAERTTSQTEFRHADLNLHFVHVNRTKGRSCRVCHEIHASDQPGHIREYVPFGPNNWKLPIGFEKAPTGGSCTPGCHRAHAYERGE